MYWYEAKAKEIDEAARQQALARQAQLTKPPGSLGRLEEIVVLLAGLQGRAEPRLDNINTVVFAADHGVAEEGVSAFPQSVTVEMIRNFSAGGAAISVLCKQNGSRLQVVDVGAISDPGPLPGVLSQRVGAATMNFCHGPAMSDEQLQAALQAGKDAVERQADADLFIGGEMGIANTTSATALACALLQRPPQEICGPGTGLDAQGISHKAKVIGEALARHAPHLDEATEVLRRLGGFEIAALVGSYIRCAQLGIPVLLDGYISGVAALLAQRINPFVATWMLQSHNSAEPGHAAILQALGLQALLSLDMRLGEASGAAVALPLLRIACVLHQGMATFAQAAVSGQKQ